MPHKYFYDDSGLPTSYLLLSILFPIAVILTYTHIRRKKVISCKCSNCLKHKNIKQSRWSLIFLALLWTLISFLVKNVLTIKHESKAYNPYEVLGLEVECTKSQVKSAFRKLALKNDPHKFKDDEKVKAEKKLRDIAKAYNMINEGIKIDTEASVELMAIPDWLISKGTLILIVYFIFLGVLLPRFAYLKYKSNNLKNRFNVSYKSVDLFYKLMTEKEDKKINDSFIKHESFLRWLILFISNTDDLKNHKYKRNINNKPVIEEKYGYPIKEEGLSYYILMDHLFRCELAHPTDLDYVQRTSLSLIQSFKEIARRKCNILLLNRLFVLERMVVQAVFDEEYSDLQVGAEFEEIFARKFKKEGKIKKGFVKPEINISNIKAYVEQTNLLDSHSVYKDNSFVLPENSKVTLSFNVELIGPTMVHAPFLKEDIFTTWSIFLLINDSLTEEYIEVKEKDKSVKFTFNGTNKPMNLKIACKNGGYFDIDKEESINVKFIKLIENTPKDE